MTRLPYLPARKSVCGLEHRIRHRSADGRAKGWQTRCSYGRAAVDQHLGSHVSYNQWQTRSCRHLLRDLRSAPSRVLWTTLKYFGSHQGEQEGSGQGPAQCTRGGTNYSFICGDWNDLFDGNEIGFSIDLRSQKWMRFFDCRVRNLISFNIRSPAIS